MTMVRGHCLAPHHRGKQELSPVRHGSPRLPGPSASVGSGAWSPTASRLSSALGHTDRAGTGSRPNGRGSGIGGHGNGHMANLLHDVRHGASSETTSGQRMVQVRHRWGRYSCHADFHQPAADSGEHPSGHATSAGARPIQTSVTVRSMPANPGSSTSWRTPAPDRSNTSTTSATARTNERKAFERGVDSS